jgi:two-component system chemotaxis response regulator CheY
MKALVVSDSATIRRILAHALHAAGCDEVLAFTDGREAADVLDGGVHALATDWGLPGLTGIELTSLIRAREDCAGIRVLMVTSRNARSDVERAIDSGVDVYLLKPFTPDALRLKIDELLQPIVQRELAARAAEEDSEAPEASAA